MPPINEVNRKLEKIEKSIKRQDEFNDKMRYISLASNFVNTFLVKILFCFSLKQNFNIGEAVRTIKNYPRTLQGSSKVNVLLLF